jgi:hypothetical protein
VKSSTALPVQINQRYSQRTNSDLLTRTEAIELLRVTPSHLSKIVNGKVKHLPRLPVVNLGRRQLFRRSSLELWILEVEALSCNGDR